MPPLEALGPGRDVGRVARLGNDGMAELCRRISRPLRRLAGFAADERAGRCGEGSRARLQAAAANGCRSTPTSTARRSTSRNSFRCSRPRPSTTSRCFCIPRAGRRRAGLQDRKKSKYEIWWTFGWPYETLGDGASGVLRHDRQAAELKVLAHHLGAMVPFFEGRVGPGGISSASARRTRSYNSLC